MIRAVFPSCMAQPSRAWIDVGDEAMTRTRRLSAALALAFLAAAGPALANPTSTDPAKVPAGAYALDKRHASLVVKIAHMGGFSHYTMRFDGLDGGFTYDPANWQATKVDIAVDAKSIDTGNAPFDKQIAGYFEADKYPLITFASTGITAGADGKGTLTGDLTFHGVTKPVSLDVTFNGVGHGVTPLGTRLGFSGTGRIKRTDFGIGGVILSQFTSEDVDLLIEVEFEKK
jgi:polyisoprenoid-binding protein YceI